MSLYLQFAVGDGRYLLDAAHVLEIGPDVGGDSGTARQRGEGAPTVDLRVLFAAPAAAAAFSIVVIQPGGGSATLVVDRVEGLAEYGDAEFRGLPPIGPIGEMIDAVAVRPADQRLLLRLRGECVLAIATALG